MSTTADVPDTTARSWRGYHHDHARRRARERYGLDATAVARIEAVIRDGTACDRIELFRPKHGVSHAVYAVRLDQRWYPVIFDVYNAMAVSFPPVRMLIKYRHEIESQGTKPPGGHGSDGFISNDHSPVKGRLPC
jgi:hypothetical protein